MAHKKGMGSTRNGRESHSKRLGVKIFGGQVAIPGNIIVRQRGTQHHPGTGVGLGKDHTIFAKDEGIVYFKKGRKDRSFVSVVSPKIYNKLMGALVEERVAPQFAQSPTTIKEGGARKMIETKKVPAKAEFIATDSQSKLLSIVGEVDASSADDLKKLTGLGPATEKKLNDIGIYSYVQVAKLTKPANALIEELTGFKAEKIEKSDWVGEVKKLK